jgi:hypothetical protein
MIGVLRPRKGLAALASLALGLSLGLAGCNDDGPGDKDDTIVNESGPVDTKPNEAGVQPPGTDEGVVNANPADRTDVNKSTTTGPDQGGGPPEGVPPAGDTGSGTGTDSGDAGKADTGTGDTGTGTGDTGTGGDATSKPE